MANEGETMEELNNYIEYLADILQIKAPSFEVLLRRTLIRYLEN